MFGAEKDPKRRRMGKGDSPTPELSFDRERIGQKERKNQELQQTSDPDLDSWTPPQSGGSPRPPQSGGSPPRPPQSGGSPPPSPQSGGSPPQSGGDTQSGGARQSGSGAHSGGGPHSGGAHSGGVAVCDNVRHSDHHRAASNGDCSEPAGGATISDTVATHYNQVPETGRERRKESRILHMRNFNNWIKSVLINQFITEIRRTHQRINVLDLCSGKGGDLLKWTKADIDHLICVDIAATSVEQSRTRHEDNLRKPRGRPRYSAEFHVADCTRTRIRDLYQSASIQLDLVSCQFSFHYCFESYQQTMMMLRNVSESLRPGGFFICTTLNSNELVKRWRDSPDSSFGNDVYKVKFESQDKEKIPLFGAKYYFYLEGSVMDCPEFLVHFPLLEKLALEHGLALVYKKTFEEYFCEQVGDNDNRNLLTLMKAMEPYPAPCQVSSAADDYQHARVRLEQLCGGTRVGTISRAEWEAITLYLVCAFKKL